MTPLSTCTKPESLGDLRYKLRLSPPYGFTNLKTDFFAAKAHLLTILESLPTERVQIATNSPKIGSHSANLSASDDFEFEFPVIIEDGSVSPTAHDIFSTFC